MRQQMSRRNFLQHSGGVGACLTILPGRPLGRSAPSDRLHIGIVGVANRGAGNLKGVLHENIVALCDIDDKLLAKAAYKFPKARRYNDFRKMMEQRDLDAVVISTPDHTHAVAAMAAIHMGKHVYCEKPLTHTVQEARKVTKAARETGVMTQMGTQIHSENNYRRVVELIQSGTIGPVSEVHVWVPTGYGNGNRPGKFEKVPENIHWDLWLGPSPFRPYHSDYMPFTWRQWWDFGNGTLADFGCHYLDLPCWALELGPPESIEAKGPAVHPETTPRQLIVRYQFPARKHLPALNLTWYDDGLRPPHCFDGRAPGNWNSGVLFVGSQGMLISDYSRYRLLPETSFRDFVPPEQTIPPSKGHHKEWIDACKGGPLPLCNFDYAGLLTETALLGTVAFRSGQRLEWNSDTLVVTNTNEADQFLRGKYRQGWSL